jgi:iron complex outermembrane receptor protein
MKAGLFHSEERHPANFNPYLLLQSTRMAPLQSTPIADYALDVSPPNTATSVSGELRLSRTFQATNHRGELQFTVRGRSVDQAFGGDSNTDFGVIAFGSLRAVAEPRIVFGPTSPDEVRQLDVGVSFEERWRDVGSIEIGGLRSRYSRTIDVPPGPADTKRTARWLQNARFTIEALPVLTFFGSYVEGLEDSARAPLIAANRGESPAATPTSQIDGGVRFAPGGHLQLILGAFDIRKPYLAVDSKGVFEPVGRLKHSGLETSVSFTDNGLTALAGAVLLKPRIGSLAPELGTTGDVPLGPVPLTLIANVDYAPLAWGPWGASLAWNRLSSRVATFDGHGYLPPVATLGAGLRYQRKSGDRAWSVRLDGYNVANAQALYLASSGYLAPDDGRQIQLTIAIDL